MEEGQFHKIQGWFEALDRKFETLDRKFEALDCKFEALDCKFEVLDEKVEDVRAEMVTKQQFENRFRTLFVAMTNLHTRVETYKQQQDEEITLIKRALHV